MKQFDVVIRSVLAGLLASIAGCTNRLAPTINKGVIMPLAVGNQWIGRTQLPNGQEVFDTLRIVRDTIVRNETWYVTGTEVMLANRPDGLYSWNIYAARKGGGKPRRLLKFPIAVGDALDDLGSFTRVFEDGQEARPVRQVLMVMATDTVIDVPAGRFHCLQAVLQRWNLDGTPDKVKFNNEAPLYFAPGIGLLQTSGYRPNLGTVISIGSGVSPWQLYRVSIH